MKSLGFVLLWLLGSIAAVSVAFAGIALVDDELVAPPAAQVANVNDARPPSSVSTPPEQTSVAERATTADSSSTTTTDTSTTTSTTTSAPVEPTPQPSSNNSQALQETPTTTRATSISSSTSATTPATTSSTSSAPQTSSSTAQAPSTSTTTTVSPPTSSPAQVRTFNLVGGTTAISYSSAKVEILWATPNPGFDVEIKSGSGPGSVRVEFESDGHKSRIDAWWSNGPQQEIREDD